MVVDDHEADNAGYSTAVLVALAVGLSSFGQADDGPRVVTGVFCDTENEIDSFAEAHLGAQMSVLEATRAINKAAGKEDACAPITNVIVSGMTEVKEKSVGGKAVTITRLTVVGVMTVTPGGLHPQSFPGLEQYVLTPAKGEEKARICERRTATLAGSSTWTQRFPFWI